MATQTSTSTLDSDWSRRSSRRSADRSQWADRRATGANRRPTIVLASGDAFRSSPVMFIENAGQWDERARFQAWGGIAGTMWLAEDAIWITVVERPTADDTRSHVDTLERFDQERENVQRDNLQRKVVNIKLSFVGANPHPRIEPFDRLDTVVSYFIGNEPDQWRPDVPVWGGTRYVDLYPGVDLELTSEGGQMVQRLATRNGADLSATQLRVEGVDAVAVDGDVLRLTTAAGEVAWPLLLAEGCERRDICAATRHASVRSSCALRIGESRWATSSRSPATRGRQLSRPPLRDLPRRQ